MSQRMTRRKEKMVYIRFLDRVFFRNTKESRKLGPMVRETIGWLVEDCDGYIRLLWERSVEKLPHERMIILKPLILEIKEVDLE